MQPSRVIDYEDWSMKCKNCGYAHYFGNAPLSCRTKATSHALRKMHTVAVRVNGLTIETIAPEETSDRIPFEVDEPPF